MTRTLTTILAASALVMSSAAGFACDFHKMQSMASHEGEMTKISEAAPATEDAVKKAPANESLATSDVETREETVKSAE